MKEKKYSSPWILSEEARRRKINFTLSKDPLKEDFYTSAKEVEYIFTQVIDTGQFTGKTVYLPCDTDTSEFTIWLEAHKEEYRIEKLINTCDDYATHEDLFREADFVITNPPYSLTNHISKLCRECGTKFFLFGNAMKMFNDKEILYEDVKIPKRIEHVPFTLPDGTLKEVNTSIYMTNMDLRDGCLFRITLTKTFDECKRKHVEVTFKDGSTKEMIMLDRCLEIPTDYDGEMLVPTTAIQYADLREAYDFSHDWAMKIKTPDGKKPFKRYIIKKRP